MTKRFQSYNLSFEQFSGNVMMRIISPVVCGKFLLVVFPDFPSGHLLSWENWLSSFSHVVQSDLFFEKSKSMGP